MGYQSFPIGQHRVRWGDGPRSVAPPILDGQMEWHAVTTPPLELCHHCIISSAMLCMFVCLFVCMADMRLDSINSTKLITK